jgi:Disulphide bond corrector protein DsbC
MVPGRRLRLPLALALLVTSGGCGVPELPPLTARYQANGVTVAVDVRPVADGHLLSATFTPKPGFHLYSAQLPPGGVDGLGFPTVLAAGRGLHATGPVSADRAVTVLRVPALGVDLPVYPDGPVTLTEPVEAGSGARWEASIGYAACSASTCLMPVTGQVVALTRTAAPPSGR